ncbi:MAG: radical SAM protein [Bdellovibrionota bacterium]
MKQLEDSHGRRFQYLRLSVTDACNFRCVYCLPNGFSKTTDEAPLSVSEIRNLVRAFVNMGFWKFRITGGEPTLRRDIVEIARTISEIPGVRKLAMTTNGYRLKELAHPLKAAGITALNISVDSLDAENFNRITGTKRFDEVMAGVRTAFDAGFKSLKINTVLLRGWNDFDLDRFLDWIKNVPISIRFIELMRTGDNKDLYEKRHLSGGEIQLKLFQQGFKMLQRIYYQQA